MEKRMTEADGRALVELWQASGQRAATFCREQGIAAHRLSYWQQRVAELDGDGSERIRRCKPVCLVTAVVYAAEFDRV